MLFEHLEVRRLLASAPLNSIQAAIDSAQPGSTLTVGAGTVTELVTINKPLTIRGARFGVDARDASRGQGETVINGAPLTDGKESTSFYITANDVTIDGFTVQDDSSSNVYGAGIVIAPGVHGTHIVNNIVRSNVAGMYLANNSATDPAVIQHNVFKDNNLAGTNSGRGIYSDGGVSGGNLTRVIIDGNTFLNNVGFGPPANPEAAIGLEAQTQGKQSNITITNNVMQGNGKGVLLYNVENVEIAGNAMAASTDVNSAAIRIAGGANNVTIEDNSITGNLGAAIRVSKIFAGPNSNVDVTANNLFGNAKGGLIVDSGAYKGTLDATINWWGSKTGPAGDGPGFGDTVFAADGNVNFDPWATALLGSDSASSNTPRGLREILIVDLASVRAQITGHLRHFMNDAITNFKASLATALWVDDSHLAPGAGKTLFDLDRKAVDQLRHIVKELKKSGLPDGLVQTIQRVTNLERMMAMIAIDAASAGDPKKLVKANHDLSDGVNEVAQGNSDLAISDFLDAWQLAMQAAKHKKPSSGQADATDLAAIVSLQTIDLSLTKKDLLDKINQAISKLTQTASGQTSDGNQSFDLAKDAVHNLMDVAGDKDASNQGAGLTTIIQRIAADRATIAKAAINAAVGGKTDHLQNANNELAQGVLDYQSGNFDASIDRFKNAWHEANDALQSHGGNKHAD